MMEVKTYRIRLKTKGNCDLLDLTSEVQGHLKKSGLKDGTANVFAVGSTAGISTIEYEPGLVADMRNLFDRIAPQGAEYQHELRWHDGNGHSHVRATLMGPNLSVPFERGELLLGTWQQIVYHDFDARARTREVVVQLMGI
jgi:secondary thiamine-phosphate synthase enzyme